MKVTRNYLNNLFAGATVTIRRITEDQYGRTVAELFKDPMNIKKHFFLQKNVHLSMKSMQVVSVS